MVQDDDRRPFEPRPRESYSGLLWDAADQMVFAPLARPWMFAVPSEAANVNALDEVPNSSWFEDRSGPRALSPRQVARGPCVGGLQDAADLLVTSGKPDGDNPGFVARTNDGRRFVFKFDSMGHVRATTAEVIASRLYYAAGYHVPCNRIVELVPSRIRLARGATARLPSGELRLVDRQWLSNILAKAARGRSGLVRASASEFLAGTPLGPFRYSGTRSDDPNDVVPHEDRRELRASRVVAAWLGHTDSREANTLDTWRVEPRTGQGHVEHHLIDFGDCLGSVWEPPSLGRRIGSSAYFDVPDIVTDWLTLGLIPRIWEARRFGRFGAVLGYFDVEHFAPDGWTPGYDNPAMLRMTERDAAFIARRLARLRVEHIAAAVAEARLDDRMLAREIVTILMGRRRRILERYLRPLSPLAWATVTGRAPARLRPSSFELCVEDLAVTSGDFDSTHARYAAVARHEDGSFLAVGRPHRTGDSWCVEVREDLGTPRETSATTTVKWCDGLAREGCVSVEVFRRGSEAPRVVRLVRLEATH